VYQTNHAAATGVGSNRKAPCLGYTPRAGVIHSLTQRYDPVSLSQYVEYCHEARSLCDVLDQSVASFLLMHRSDWSIVVGSGLL